MRHSSRKWCTFWMNNLTSLRAVRFFKAVALFFLASDFITCQSFTENSHKRTIPRKKHAIKIIFFVNMLSRDIESDQCLACPRHAGYKANRLAGVYS